MPKKTTKNKKKANLNKKVNSEKIQALELFLIVLLALFVIISIASVFLFCHIAQYNASAQKSVSIPVSTVISKVATNMPAQESIGVPVRIKIPSINVDAAVERVGLKNDGSMDVPKDPMNTGWYEPGPRPGELGSAVMDGHVDWWYGATAVFAGLKEVKPGYVIIVEDDTGKTIPFIIREIRTYGATDNATDIFISNDGKPHLNLITCAGAWDIYTNQYSNRLVVFADRDYR
ncbi:MAG: class F sortase [Patescibacteria group bacterium]|nr:class F sortase [Patescibacteria group bacterium]